MLKVVSVFLLVLGVVLFSICQWMAFEIYVNSKLTKMSQNVAQFTYGLYFGESLIKLPNSSENIFLIRAKDGKVITTNNTVGPLSIDDFTFAERSKEGNYIYVYAKKININDYLSLLVDKPLTLGVSLSGLILFLFGLFLILRNTGISKVEKVVSMPDENLIKRLKALRVSLAMGELIPRESLQEAKKIVEDIIKRMEGEK